MNPYYANWSYGYTLQPSSEATRGAYGVQYGGHGAGGGGHHGHGQPPVPQHGASNWGQIKGRYREVCGVYQFTYYYVTVSVVTCYYCIQLQY